MWDVERRKEGSEKQVAVLKKNKKEKTALKTRPIAHRACPAVDVPTQHVKLHLSMLASVACIILFTTTHQTNSSSGKADKHQLHYSMTQAEPTVFLLLLP